MVLVELVVCLGTALVNVELLVLFQALVVAILHVLAFAYRPQNVPLIAVLAVAYHLLLSFSEFKCEFQFFGLPKLNHYILSFVEVYLVHA